MFPVFFLAAFVSSMAPALLRHSSNSLEDVEHWYVRRLLFMGFGSSWEGNPLKMTRNPVYDEKWVTWQQNKNAGKEMLKFVVTDDKQGFVLG